MNEITLNQNPEVFTKFESYPKEVKPKLEYLRALILETAKECNHVSAIEETLKWSEPSYLVRKGSTIRIDWKAKSPEQYAMYFKCTSKLVSTFKAIYGNIFKYEKNRAIIFNLEDEVPKEALKDCIKMALSYHLIKNEPPLGKEK